MKWKSPDEEGWRAGRKEEAGDDELEAEEEDEEEEVKEMKRSSKEWKRTNEEKTRWQIGASASQLIIYWTSGAHRTTHKEKMVHLLIRRHRMELEN